MAPEPSHAPRTALLLTGGGARAAYQVGVLQALARIRRDCAAAGGGNPFPILVGTSAGALNAAALASRADDFDAAVDSLGRVWSGFSAEQVYRADAFGVIRTGARWLTMLTVGWAIARWRRARPRSLLDNTPLEQLLRDWIDLGRVPGLMEAGHLHALAVTASSYSTGTHLTFVQARHPIQPWTRSQRLAVASPITHRHLLASAAIPFVFPAQPLAVDGRAHWCGDGSMRQAAPISPAVHLGAERILVIGAGRMHEAAARPPSGDDGAYPSLAQVAGHALSNIFLDALAVDIERLERINRTLALLPESARGQTHLRPIEVLVIAPSQRLDDLAARHLQALPAPVRTLLRGVGVAGRGEQARGAALASYLLFESAYTAELMALGTADTLARRDEVARFFGWCRRRQVRLPAAVPPPLMAGVE
ncbi:patatin-like phospholipase family protein [Aquariibacter albus]|uniref:Patatin-like phospholipase family protein n=1 Tax=Aquariibacter albus TaxID=2759899 RepID=A0A839HNL8_9BURK|nr:patatin-like phospholipase family protein [Aquariibacter albus]MBB1161020.1 patatin-like phospholipase family protein [Aquariibacter albus]